MLNIPKFLWFRTVFVRNRVDFINQLAKGEVGDFIDARSCSKERSEMLLKEGWQMVKFGLNCVLM